MALVGDSNGLQPCRGFFKDQKNETIRKRLYASYNTGPFTVYIQIQRLTFVMNNRVKSRDVCFLYFCILK